MASNRALRRRRPVGQFVYCMFAMDVDSPPCQEPATETMPGFMPPYYLCLEHRRLVEALIDMAT